MRIEISYLALFIPIVGLFLAFLNFRRKSGLRIRGDCSITWDIASDDSYISSITLENLKDRAVPIFSIYYKIGRNNYIEIENCADTPIILKPYEVYQKKYSIVYEYNVNAVHVNIEDLFKNRKIGVIVLSTSSGRYVVRNFIKKWSVTSTYFNNHGTNHIIPVRKNYQGTFIGGNISYVLELSRENKKSVHFLNKHDLEAGRLFNFQISSDPISGKEGIEKAINFLIENNAIKKSSFNIIEVLKNTRTEEKFIIKCMGIIEYYVCWKYKTIKLNAVMRINNFMIKNKFKKYHSEM
jgi:hypothetical protein